MRITPPVLAVVLCGGLLIGCKARETAAPEVRQIPSPAPTVEPAVPPAVEVSPVPVEPTPPNTEAEPTKIPKAPAAAVRQPRAAGEHSSSPPPRRSETAPEPTYEAPVSMPRAAPAPTPAASPPAESASKVADPGGVIAVAATKAGVTRIGAEKCKVCHKIQFASWLETAHAKRKPPLDCENCHGPGSEYKALAIMKDREKAKAAGLVMPTATFCKTCHARDWKDEMLRKAHAHKS